MNILRLPLTVVMLFGALIYLPGSVAAAPFCIESRGVPSQCWYYDVRECKTEAGKEHARCSVNLKEIMVSEAGGSYCIVDSAKRPECAYQSWESCEEVATRRIGSICFLNSMKQSSDPYRDDRMPIQLK